VAAGVVAIVGLSGGKARANSTMLKAAAQD
jgi:hypothetical protein